MAAVAGSIGLLPDQVVPLTTRIANQLKLTDTKGALIYQMLKNSSAYQAGILPGDVVVSFNGTPVDDPGHLTRLVSDSKIGSVVAIGIIRDGRRQDLKVTITRPPSSR